jgi:hypothetical protein
MADDHEPDPTPKTQLTQPKEGEPIEIPVPKEREIEDLLSRAAKPSAAPSVGGEHPDADEDQ